jgi:AmpD protein
VLHATVEPTLKGSVSILRERGFSYHFLIDRDGTSVQCVSPKDVAFHAGPSKGPQGEGVNEYSIGISFVNLNDGKDPFTEAQIAEAQFIVHRLKQNYKELKYITTHAAISPGRKDDPAGFPLEAFAMNCELRLWI